MAFVGFQEYAKEGHGLLQVTRDSDYNGLASQTKRKGFLGCALWINKNVQFLFNGDKAVYVCRDSVTLVLDDPRCLIVTINVKGTFFFCVVAHAPHIASKEDNVLEWW